ncbi:MAG TPA: FUSC family protein [Candidatus Nanopelagicales bacterium]
MSAPEPVPPTQRVAPRGRSSLGQRPPAADWRIPGQVLRLAAVVAAALLAPLILGYLLQGTTAAIGVVLGFAAAIGPARMVPARFAAALTVPAAMAGAVAVEVHGNALPAACFAALACLLVAPANMYGNGLLAGVPTAAAFLASDPAAHDPGVVGGWMLVGGLALVALVSKLPGARPAPDRLDAWTAWVHAAAMAASAGAVVAVLNVVEVPHGAWIPVALTVALRPFRAETRTVARQRIVGTVVGALLGLVLALLVPPWLALGLCGVLLVLLIATALLGRATQQVVCLTPLIVLLGPSGLDAMATVRDRILTTLVGALLATLVALAIARLTREHERQSAPGGAAAQGSESVA